MSYQSQSPTYYQQQSYQQPYYQQPQPYCETQAERVSMLQGQGHLVVAAFLSLAATVLLTLVTFSSPFIPSIHFLHSENRKFGALGYCPTWDLARPNDCWGPVLGYEWKPWIPGGWLVKILILYGIASVFSLLAMFSLLPAFVSHHSATHMRAHGAIFRLFAIPAALSATFAFGFSTYLFGKALSDFQNSGVPNTGFGPAIWISLAGTISAILSLLVGAARDQETDGLENSGTTRNVATGEAGAAVASRKRGRFKRAHSGHVYEL